MHTKFWTENLKERDHLKDEDVNGKIILEWIVGKYGGKVWTVYNWTRIGPLARSCEHNELSGSIESEKFLD
jgi:hypothetical protein